MAARVYRNTKLSRYNDGPLSTIQLHFSTSEREGDSHSSPMPVSFSTGTSMTQPESSAFDASGNVRNMHLESQETSVKAGGTENCHVTKDCINDDAHCTLA